MSIPTVEEIERDRDILIGDFIARWDEAADGVTMDADTAQALAREFKRMRDMIADADPKTTALSRPETLRLFRASHDEIVTLRREIATLAPKAHAYDTIAAIARLSNPGQPQGYGIDVAWEIKAAVEKIEAEREAERGATSPTSSRMGL